MVSRASLILVFLCVLAPQSGAQSLDGDRFSLSFGVFVTDRDTEVSFDSSL